MDLRGMRDVDTGEWLPVTLYICVNQAEAQAFANITALLYEVLSRDFLSYGPGEKDKRGRTMGPKTICFMMDEFAKLPKSETVLTGPDLGRSKKVSYWLIRSEERRVGKECVSPCRYWWSPCHEKKKKEKKKQRKNT